MIQMLEKLNIMIIVKPFWKTLAKHRPKYDFLLELKKHANVLFWTHDGDIVQILRNLKNKHQYEPDFILHYDNAYPHFSPVVTGLEQISIPKGYYVMDVYPPASTEARTQFMEQSKFDLIFSVTKQAFLSEFPQFQKSFRWLPFSINPNVFKDFQEKKSIDYLLMGLVDFGTDDVYPFRKHVLATMKDVPGFVHHAHPGHFVSYKDATFVNERYAKEINKAKIFFTCGSRYKYPVMKFFEALACKTLLIAESNEDIKELGFADGVHYVAATKDDVAARAQEWLKHESLRSTITKNGYELVHRLHTNAHRAKQFIQSIHQLKG